MDIFGLKTDNYIYNFTIIECGSLVHRKPIINNYLFNNILA
jgi:hypothetical protein